MCKMTNKRLGVSNISGCSLKVLGVPLAFQCWGSSGGQGGPLWESVQQVHPHFPPSTPSVEDQPT